MSTMTKKYNDYAVNPFNPNQVMDFGSAKFFIEDAYAKRKTLRDLIKAIREHGCQNSDITCIHEAYFKQGRVDYRKAQKTAIQAYKKCLEDMKKSRFRGWL